MLRAVPCRTQALRRICDDRVLRSAPLGRLRDVTSIDPALQSGGVGPLEEVGIDAPDPGMVESGFEAIADGPRREIEAFEPISFVEAMGEVARVLEDHAPGLDALDMAVDPVSDGGVAEDTGRVRSGTDAAGTVSALATALDGLSDFPSIARALAESSRAAARTLSGRRLAALFAGMSEVVRNADRLDGLRLALALEAGAERLTTVDDGRHTGELPAVAARVADGALAAADQGAALGEVLVSSADAGLEELEQGPLVDGRLAERGVVDATAAAFLLLIDSLASIVTGEPLPAAPSPALDGSAGPQGTVSGATSTHTFAIRCVIDPRGGADLEAGDDLAGVLHELADVRELAVLGPRWTVDVRTLLPGAVIEALAGTGRLSEVHVGVVGT
jgi:fatty acid kinase